MKEGEAGELEEEWGLMKESLVGHTSDVCGKRFVGGCMRKGSEWWNERVKMKVEEKKRAFEEWLQCNSVESMKDIERKMWKPSEKWRKQRGCQILNGDRILIGCMRRIKEVLEGGEESEEGWIENGRDSKRCKWTVVKRK